MDERFNFKIWNKKTKKFIQSPISVGNGTFYIFNIDSVKRYEINDDVEICQSTGFKDINGNLIYEGDIVQRLKVGNSILPEVEYIGIVERYSANGGYCIKTKDKFPFKHFVYNKQAKIIGNKYENSDLLKELEK